MYKVITRKYLNCEKIHPLQQKKVLEIVEYLSQNKNVNKIILFGSSITDRCNNNSDVDLYVELNENQNHLIQKYFNFVYDLWTNYTAPDELKEEIFKKGVLVYEKK